MQCCHSNTCPSHHHQSQDCCKSMPTAKSPFLQPSAVQWQFSGHIAFDGGPEPVDVPRLDIQAFGVAIQCHAPPLPRAPTFLPIRV